MHTHLVAYALYLTGLAFVLWFGRLIAKDPKGFLVALVFVATLVVGITWVWPELWVMFRVQ